MATANVVVDIHEDPHVTPMRKRKRIEFTQPYAEVICEAKAPQTPSCFTNKAFSSTPKKFGDTKLVKLSVMEGGCNLTPINPYEVIRKPPKKKKRLEQDEELACFENQGLNLDLPEKKFNPYEVIRTTKPLCDKNCFVNAALNLKIQDSSTLANPFEIPRCDNNNSDNKEVSDCNKASCTPCKLQIALPFVPTTQHRIDFQNVSLTQLTPSKLLAEKLVFSPVLMNNFQSRKSLDVIKEESSTDIGKELDCYQLELENSINEAKLRKNDNNNKIKKTALNDIYEIPETQQNIESAMMEEKNECESNKKALNKKKSCEPDTLKSIQIKQNKNTMDDNGNLFADKADNVLNTSEKSLNIKELNDLYGEAIDEEISSGNDTPKLFIRNYRKSDDPLKDNVITKNNHQNNENGKGEQHQQQYKKLTTILRKSIRKLIPQNKEMENTKKKPFPISKNASSNIVEPSNDGCDANDGNTSSVKQCPNQGGSGIINTLRQSLRRHKKPQPTTSPLPLRTHDDDKKVTSQPSLESSIIDKTERVMKLKTNLSKMEYIKIEELTNERKLSLRGSLQRSSRLMKTVFHKKHEEYAFRK